MKKSIILCLVLLLTACIDVDDYGDYWSKTSLDPSLAGHWAKISDIDETKTTSQEWVLTVKDGAYSVQSLKNGKPTDEDPVYPVKTLDIGRYHFIASGPEKGTILRYEVNGDQGTLYVINPESAWDFIQQKFPSQTGVYRDDPDPADSAEDNRNRPLRINHFDDEVAQMLEAIPNNQVYWDPDTKLKKEQ